MEQNNIFQELLNMDAKELTQEKACQLLSTILNDWRNFKSTKPNAKELIDIIANMSCKRFTSFMRGIGQFGEDDYVVEFSPEELAKATNEAIEKGADLQVDIKELHDYYLLVLHNFNSPYFNKEMMIIGLSDDYEEWAQEFRYEELVENLTPEQEKALRYYKAAQSIMKHKD